MLPRMFILNVVTVAEFFLKGCYHVKFEFFCVLKSLVNTTEQDNCFIIQHIDNQAQFYCRKAGEIFKRISQNREFKKLPRRRQRERHKTIGHNEKNKGHARALQILVHFSTLLGQTTT